MLTPKLRCIPHACLVDDRASVFILYENETFMISTECPSISISPQYSPAQGRLLNSYQKLLRYLVKVLYIQYPFSVNVASLFLICASYRSRVRVYIEGEKKDQQMADRVHPSDDWPTQAEPISNEAEKPEVERSEKGVVSSKPAGTATTTTTTASSFNPKPNPTPGTYVVQIPKDQIYRVPPPENDRLFRRYISRRPRRGSCRRCCCTVVALLLLLLLSASLLAAVFYFVARPRSPRYAVISVSVRGFNLTAARPISPELTVGIRADNPNKAIGIYYRAGSSVVAAYDEVELARGALPVLYQGTRNVTELTVNLTASGLLLAGDVRGGLSSAQRIGNVPLDLDVTAPVRVRAWGVRSWTIKVRVKCKVGLNKLAEDANTVSSKCRVRVDPFPH